MKRGGKRKGKRNWRRQHPNLIQAETPVSDGYVH
jgi:hypothetical protein